LLPSVLLVFQYLRLEMSLYSMWCRCWLVVRSSSFSFSPQFASTAPSEYAPRCPALPLRRKNFMQREACRTGLIPRGRMESENTTSGSGESVTLLRARGSCIARCRCARRGSCIARCRCARRGLLGMVSLAPSVSAVIRERPTSPERLRARVLYAARLL